MLPTDSFVIHLHTQVCQCGFKTSFSHLYVREEHGLKLAHTRPAYKPEVVIGTAEKVAVCEQCWHTLRERPAGERCWRPRAAWRDEVAAKISGKAPKTQPFTLNVLDSLFSKDPPKRKKGATK
jgi:hypothetical protein